MKIKVNALFFFFSLNDEIDKNESKFYLVLQHEERQSIRFQHELAILFSRWSGTIVWNRFYAIISFLTRFLFQSYIHSNYEESSYGLHIVLNTQNWKKLTNHFRSYELGFAMIMVFFTYVNSPVEIKKKLLSHNDTMQITLTQQKIKYHKNS